MLIINLYDIIALVCSRICALDDHIQYEMYQKYWSNVTGGRKKLYDKFPFLNAENHDQKVLYNTLEEDEYKELKEYAEKNKGGEMFLLACLDSLIAFEESVNELLQSTPFEVSKFISLNSNVGLCRGKLIPRFKHSWEKKNARTPSQVAGKPLSIMRNYIWVENDEKTDMWEVNHVYSPKWAYSRKGPYTIVCSPLINVPPFISENKTIDGINYVQVKAYDEKLKQDILGRIETVLSFAGEQKSGITLFPEMAVAPESHSLIREKIGMNWDKEYSKIICLPSSEYKVDGKWINQTQIVDDVGKKVFEYNKQQPFPLDVAIGSEEECKFFEPIEPDHKITIIHGSGIGRIGVIICADIFNDSLLNILLEKYSLSMLLILAYSSGFDAFEKSIFNAGAKACEVIWCNCCGAYSDKDGQGEKYPVVAYYPYGHHHSMNKKILGRCSSSKQGPCSGCMMVIKIDPSYTGGRYSLTQEKIRGEN